MIYIILIISQIIHAQELKIVDINKVSIYKKRCKIVATAKDSTIQLRIFTIGYSVDHEIKPNIVIRNESVADVSFELEKEDIVRILSMMNEDRPKTIELMDSKKTRMLIFVFNENRQIEIKYRYPEKVPLTMQLVFKEELPLLKKICEWSIQEVITK